jgi:hypothetical protein
VTTPEIFQLPDDDDETDLGNITAVSVRKQANGTWFSVPMKYDIDSLDTTEKLFAMLGPGLFELVGRDDRTRQIVRRVKVNLPGVPWVSWDKPSAHEPPETRQAPPPMHQAAPGGDSGLMVAVVQLMGQQMQATSQMVMAMLQMNASNSDKHVQSMGQLFTAFGNQQSSLLERAMQQGAGADPQTAFLRGVETAAEIQRGAREGNETPEPGNELGEMVDAVAKGVDMFAKVKGLATGGEG